MFRALLLTIARGLTVILAVITLTFGLLHLAPGDPVERLLGAGATPEQLAIGRRSLGLDRPIPAQYLSWISTAARGDFGQSIARGRPAGTMLWEAWPATALLVVLSLLLTWLCGIAIGAVQANTRSRGLDTTLSAVTVTLTALPGYWLGLALVMLFTYYLRWLPAFGAVGLDAEFLTPTGQLVDRLRHIALPLLTLTLIGVGGAARFSRAAMIAVRGAPFLVAARARGITAGRIVVRHQLRNALVPVVTLLGLSLPAVFSGTVFVEAIVGWPGVGQVLVQAVQGRDYPVVMAAATISATLVVIGNLLAEILVTVADPRTRDAV